MMQNAFYQTISCECDEGIIFLKFSCVFYNNFLFLFTPASYRAITEIAGSRIRVRHDCFFG